MRWKIFKTASFIAVALLLSSNRALAQRTTATLYGSVQDPSGAVILGATVVITNEATGAKFNAAADDRGQFNVGFLPVGSYTVEVTAQGFKGFKQTGLQLNSGQEIRYPVNMEVGAASEQVTVTAEVPLVQNASVTMRRTITTDQVMELPQSARNFTSLLTLDTGVRPGAAQSGTFQFNGLAAGGSTITVDGTDAAGDAEQPLTGFYQNFNRINVISQEAIQEVQVSKGVMTAEIARTFGGNVNIVTRTGTNAFHGTLFENWQNDILNARYLYNPAPGLKAPIRFHQFGGSVGGPIIRDKLFFFGVYEGYRQRNLQNLSGNVPTKEFRDQAIAAVPAYKIFLDRFPLPTESYGGGAIVGLYRGAGANTASDNHAVVRVDYRSDDRNSLAARYTRGRPNQTQPRVVSSNWRAFDGIAEVGNLNYTRIGPTWTSESRFGLNRNDMSRIDGIWEGGKVPGLNLTGNFSDAGEGLGQGGWTWTVEELIAKNMRRHSMKTGFMFLRRRPGRWNEEVPVVRYPNVAGMLANRPDRVQVTFGTAEFEGRSWEMGFFVQDDFRLRPNLILNLGVRYEYFSVYKEREGRFYNPDGWKGAVVLPPIMRPKDSAYNGDFNNFSPRIGFAWNVDKSNKNVVRGGLGMFVAPFTIINFQTNVYTSLDIPFRSVFSGSDITSLGLKYPVYNTEVAKLITGRPVARGYLTFDPDNPNPYNYQWMLDYQRELTPTLALRMGYVGNHALKIVNQRQFNEPDRVTNVRPYPAALQFIYQDASDSSYYHALQLTLRTRLAHGLTGNVNHTWGKAISYAGGDFNWGGSGDFQDENNFRADKGPAQADITHRFVSDWVYVLPVDKWTNATGPVRHVIGGWQVSGIFNAQTGAALNVSQSGGRAAQRPDTTGANPYADQRFTYLNKSTFTLVPVSPVSNQTLRPGNVGRGSLRGPGAWTVDLGLAKNFRIREGMRLQIRLDMFNAFNHVNLGNPNTDIRNVNFGLIQNVGTERRMQLNARFSF